MSVSILQRSQSPASPSPRRVRSTTAQPCSKPSALSMSNLHVNASNTPGLLSLSRPSPNGRAKGKKAAGDKSDQVPSSRVSKGKADDPTASKPSQPDASSQAIPLPTLPQVPTPAKQRSRTRRHKRSNSDPLFPSTADENGDEPTPTTTTASASVNPPRTPGPSSSTPSGKASPPPSTTADRASASAVPSTPTPASRRGTRGGRRGQGKTHTAEPTQIPSSHAPPEAEQGEQLSHSAPSESSFMLVPEPAVSTNDGKRARGRGGKTGTRQKEASGGSGRDEPFVCDEEEGKVWDMPEKKGNDQLTWQQSILSTSTPQFPSVASPTAGRRSSPNPRNVRAPLPAAMTASQHRQTASLTWQQALLPPNPTTGSSANSAPSTVRRRNSLSTHSHGGATSSLSSRVEDAARQAQRQQSMMVATPMATPTKTTAIMAKDDVAPGKVGPSGPRYAGPMFHNSPMAGDIPKPRFGGRM